MDRERTIIGKGRIIFDRIGGDEISLMQKRRPTFRHMSFRWQGKLDKTTVMTMRTFFVVGYDPQKLLPSPEKARPLTLREWAGLYMGSPDFGSWIDRTWLDEEIVFTGRTPRPAVNFRDLYRDVPPRGDDDFREVRWGTQTTVKQDLDAATAKLLDSPRAKQLVEEQRIRTQRAITEALFAVYIAPRQSGKTEVFTPAPDSGVGLATLFQAAVADPNVDRLHIDLSAIENRQIAMYASGLLNPLSDYDRRLFPVFPKTFAEPKVVSTSSGKRDMSYLKHDPSKKNRRKRK